MRWLPRTSRLLQKVGRKLMLLAGILAALLSAAAAAGCGSASPSMSAAQSTPSLYFLVDANGIAARSNYDLRSSLVALDARNGHVTWRHALEASSPADATSARFQPVYRDGVVYVGYTYDHAADPQNYVRHGVVEALEAATGKVRWRREVGTDFDGELVVDASAVYASAGVETLGQQGATVSGLLVALDVQSGQVRWQRALQDVPSMAASADGRVFVMASGLTEGHLLALNASDGSIAWDNTSNAPLSRGGDVRNGQSDAPVVVAGRVYVYATVRNAGGTANLKLLALNARDGRVAWQHETEGAAATPAFNQGGDVLCLSAYDGAGNTSTMLGLAASSGATRWSMTGVPGIISGCAASGDTFYLTELSSDKQAGSVLALNSQDGRQLWKTPTDPPVIADGLLAPAVASGVVGVFLRGPAATPGPLTSTMAVLRVSDGKPLWRHDFGGRPDQVLDIDGDVIINPALSGGLPIIAAFARDTGAPLWTYALGHL